MSLTFDEIKDSKIKSKFYSESEDKILTRSEIIKDVTYDWHRISDEDNFNDLILRHFFPCDLVKLDTTQKFRRWDERERRMRIHKFECEFSTSDHCSCWCNDEYHGLRGQPTLSQGGKRA